MVFKIGNQDGIFLVFFEKGEREYSLPRTECVSSTCPGHKVGISGFSSFSWVYFLVRKSGFQLYLANSY